ncbi:hypothetical protein M422DRAFT_276905 [Sphaerobolus stellatus SS14]|uniref:Uncharacterized protein n=1 Tax=Sphaerobolus stellatus (strain SS14) TaxID=990650 RepID=A0A0C9T1H6_SPHS4|nr:hypothetical protein M422DRAFT_276905 [Sphaerobolus stellatus SS14]
MSRPSKNSRMVTEDEMPKAKESVKAAEFAQLGSLSTIRQRQNIKDGPQLLAHIAIHAPNGEAKLAGSYYTSLLKQMAQLSAKYGIEKTAYKGEYFGPAGFRIILDHVLTTVEDRLQTMASICMQLIAGARPGAMGLAYPELEAMKQFLQHKNLTLTRQDHATIDVMVHFENLTRHNNGDKNKLKLDYPVKAVSNPENVTFELGLILSMLLFVRGALYYSTIEYFFKDKSFIINIRSEFKEKAVFQKA